MILGVSGKLGKVNLGISALAWETLMEGMEVRESFVAFVRVPITVIKPEPTGGLKCSFLLTSLRGYSVTKRSWGRNSRQQHIGRNRSRDLGAMLLTDLLPMDCSV